MIYLGEALRDGTLYLGEVSEIGTLNPLGDLSKYLHLVWIESGHLKEVVKITWIIDR